MSNFIESAASRETSVELMEAIHFVAGRNDDPAAVAKQSLSVESAAHVRADRIVSSKANPADKARERGFRDAMMGLPSRRNEFGKISQVSYDQGVERAKKLRESLAVRGWPWTETELERDGSKWRWAIYEEGKHIASGEAKTEKAAGQAVDDARIRAAEARLPGDGGRMTHGD